MVQSSLLQILDKDNADALVYDNELGEEDDAEPTTEIVTGQITIHRR